MIPYSFIFAVVFTGWFFLSAIQGFKTVSIKTRNGRMFYAFALSFCVSLSWAMFVTRNWVDVQWFYWGFISFMTVCLTVLFVAVTWKDDNKQVPKEVSYTPETLVGQTGRIVSSMGGLKYLGKLDDSAESQIIVTILNDNPVTDDKFTVISIVDCDILAEIQH